MLKSYKWSQQDVSTQTTTATAGVGRKKDIVEASGRDTWRQPVKRAANVKVRVTSVFDSPQLSVSFNVQDGGRALVLKKVSSFELPLQASYFMSPLSWKKQSQSNDCQWLHGPKYHCPSQWRAVFWSEKDLTDRYHSDRTSFLNTLVEGRAAYFAYFIIFLIRLQVPDRALTSTEAATPGQDQVTATIDGTQYSWPSIAKKPVTNVNNSHSRSSTEVKGFSTEDGYRREDSNLSDQYTEYRSLEVQLL